ncbi:uncharacterized protein LOC131318869 isoform X2 [Rhododendron vialii]|uniref:uncharacterized protein LOC131318869 isoform X1 n=1 Tax=Rhododendron vialii TaxID=182163 RepID=UPI00265FD809|nr:uncharacterized protein LOC131318869 isoform X1 [Rhododendron vialii]XP_058204870.1 uncharacterized protein LOC131318869 isoform X2 [Rhododendron vialii]
MACATVRQLLHPTSANPNLQFWASPFTPYSRLCTTNYTSRFSRLAEYSCGHRNLTPAPRALPGNKGGGSAADEDDNDDDGVSLGTMKLPLDTDLPRFETLLFQWANSLFQGANLPLPVPLKVDKIPGGARLGFITIGDGSVTEVLVYIDCLVFPATSSSGPIFRAIRNGPSKGQPAPGEPRIMRSLLQAIKKSAEIARV